MYSDAGMGGIDHRTLRISSVVATSVALSVWLSKVYQSAR